MWAEQGLTKLCSNLGDMLGNHWARADCKPGSRAQKWAVALPESRSEAGAEPGWGLGCWLASPGPFSPSPPHSWAGTGCSVGCEQSQVHNMHPPPPVSLALILILQAPEAGRAGGGAVMGFGVGEGKR